MCVCLGVSEYILGSVSPSPVQPTGSLWHVITAVPLRGRLCCWGSGGERSWVLVAVVRTQTWAFPVGHWLSGCGRRWVELLAVRE